MFLEKYLVLVLLQKVLYIFVISNRMSMRAYLFNTVVIF